MALRLEDNRYAITSNIRMPSMPIMKWIPRKKVRRRSCRCSRGRRRRAAARRRATGGSSRVAAAADHRAVGLHQLADHLPAGAAGADHRHLRGEHQQGLEAARRMALADGGEQRTALGAVGQPVGAVFHVAAEDHLAVMGEQRRPGESGIGAVGPCRSLDGLGQQPLAQSGSSNIVHGYRPGLWVAFFMVIGRPSCGRLLVANRYSR